MENKTRSTSNPDDGQLYHSHPGGDVDRVNVVAEDERIKRLSAARWRPDLLDALGHLGQALGRQLVEVLDRLDGHPAEDLRQP